MVYRSDWGGTIQNYVCTEWSRSSCTYYNV